MGPADGRGERLPAFDVTTLADTASEVLAAARRGGFQGLHALPFNRFHREDTTWWLSPSPENPAYRHGKIVLTRRDAAPGALFVGLYIEKGVGPAAAPAYRDTAKGRRYVMDPTWLWDRLVGALGSGNFEQTATAAVARAASPLTIVVDASLVPPPAGDDVHSPSLPRDVVRLAFSDGELRFLDADTPGGLLKSLVTAETLPALAARIGTLPQLDWLWIDFQAGLRLVPAGGSRRSSAWSAAELWERACRPWRAWLQ
jgi:hypothetical protein